ncbi:hypothetical protein [[Ruminococcus] torques]|uniref:hypothetical protein n=1 Tax=[Ruminococcus] torques TaxID=33039 RepID=UPI002F3FB211
MEARISYLAYVPGMVAVMLQRQQASAIVDARKTIVDGQIEHLLTECARQRKKKGKYVSEHLNEPTQLDIS